MLNLMKKKGLSREALRKALERDLDSRGPGIKCAILYADSLMERTPGTWMCGGRRILCGMCAEEYVVMALRLMLAGERRVHGYLGGLLTLVRDLVADARSEASEEQLLDEVRDRFRPQPRQVPVGSSVPGPMRDPEMSAVACRLLAGMTPLEIASDLGCPLKDVLIQVQSIQRMAMLAC